MDIVILQCFDICIEIDIGMCIGTCLYMYIDIRIKLIVSNEILRNEHWSELKPYLKHFTHLITLIGHAITVANFDQTSTKNK